MNPHRAANYRHRQRILGGLRWGLQGWARCTGRRFACRSLSGSAPDGLFVNADMSLSCNCQDVDGRGQLGSLRTNTLEDILAGPIATGFRQALAAGRLPIARCAACWHLQTVSTADAAKRAQEVQLPKGLSVENTVHCNLRCLSCCRAQILTSRKGGTSLSLGDVQIIAATLARIGATYCGYYNLGEPFYSNDILEQLRILRAAAPNLRIITSTNGALLDSDSKREAALLLDDIMFSIDGVDTPMVQRYQRGGDFDRAYANLKALIDFRNARGLVQPRIYWKYVVFRWNDRPAAVQRAMELAAAAGVDCLQFVFARNPWYGMSWRFFLSPAFRAAGVREGWRFRNVWFSRRPDVAWPAASQQEKAA